MFDLASSPTPRRIGLVLGGGGMTGMAFHAGVLHAVERTLRVDVGSVDLIVGTSAGALVGSLLRRGVGPAELRAWCLGERLPTGWAATRAAVRQEWDRMMQAPRHLPLRMPWQIGADLLAGRDWRSAMLALTPDAGVDHGACVEHFSPADRRWPTRPMWVCAVERPTGDRVVFGRDRTVPFATALAASSAMPGLFRTVEFGGVRYCDGGVRSMTNLDVVAGESLDAVIVSSPLSLRASLGWLDGLPSIALRRVLHRQLRREVARVRRSGAAVLTLEPDWRTTAALGFDAMAQHRLPEVVHAADAAADATFHRSAAGAHFVEALRGRTIR